MSKAKFKNPVVKWIDHRLPIFSFMDHELNHYPTPKNLNYFWNFGSLAGIALVTMIITGIVLSKSLFNSSMNYTSAVIFGSTKRITNEEVMNSAFENMIDRFFEGRYADAKKPTESEWKQTAVLEFTIDEFSMKKRSGPPIEAEEDVDLPIWSGVVPINSSFGKPEKDMTTSKNLDLPEYLG